MKILAIDSSSTPASVAVTEGCTPIGEFTININRTHSEKLLPIVDLLLDTVNLSAKDIDAFAVSVGPGSFTGLRIGMSAAKLLAQTSGKPLIGIKTLEALAENTAVFNGYIFPVLDARNNFVYTALYESDGSTVSEIFDAEAITVDEFCTKILSLDKPVLITGEYAKYKEKILSFTENKADVFFAPTHLASQRAVSVAVLADERLNNGEITIPEDIIPFYVRESQAEQSKKAKEAKL